MSLLLALRALRRETDTPPRDGGPPDKPEAPGRTGVAAWATAPGAVISILGLGAIVIAVLTTRILMAVQPIDVLVSKVTPDDAFYYFQAAHNIVRGEGPSLDGLNDANGFHALWMALLLPLAPFGRDTLVHGALVLGVAMDVASVFALWWALGGLTKNATIRLVAVAAYALNPAIAFGAVNGLESSVSVLSLIILFGLLLRAKDFAPEGPAYWALVGYASGIAVLARTDNGMFVVPILLFLALRSRSLRPPLLAGAIASLITLPWFAWNVAAFGTPLQVSGEATYVLSHIEPLDTRTAWETVQHGAGLTKTAFLDSIPDLYFFSKPVLGVVVGGLTGLTALAARRSGEARAIAKRHAPLLATLTIGLLALVVAHAGIRWHTREWYFLPAVPLSVLWLAYALEVTFAWLGDVRLPSLKIRYATVIPLVVLAAIVAPQVTRGLDWWDDGRYYWCGDTLRAAQWLRDETPEGTRVAGFNVGVLSYYAERPTTNLDGVMNPNALDALDKRELLAYVDGLAVDFVVDFNSYIFLFYEPLWGGPVNTRLEQEQSFQAPAFALFGTYQIYHFR